MLTHIQADTSSPTNRYTYTQAYRCTFWLQCSQRPRTRPRTRLRTQLLRPVTGPGMRTLRHRRKYTCLSSYTHVRLPNWATEAHRHTAPDPAAFAQITFAATKWSSCVRQGALLVPRWVKQSVGHWLCTVGVRCSYSVWPPRGTRHPSCIHLRLVLQPVHCFCTHKPAPSCSGSLHRAGRHLTSSPNLPGSTAVIHSCSLSQTTETATTPPPSSRLAEQHASEPPAQS